MAKAWAIWLRAKSGVTTMLGLTRPALAAALIAYMCMPAFAADYVEPPVVEAPPPPVFGGWYIRGDIDWHWTDFKGADYITYGVDCCGDPVPGTNSFTSGDLDGAFSLGAGVGYQITSYLRTDLTL